MNRTRIVPACVASALLIVVPLRRLRLPRHHIGRRVAFADGTVSQAYRETVLDDGVPTQPAVLVIRFRLRVLGRNRWAHALFRFGSMPGVLLLAGSPGVRSKLWLTDERTGVYRGVSEWEGIDRPRAYATVMCALLRLVSTPGTVGFHVEPGARLVDLFAAPPSMRSIDPPTHVRTADDWWRTCDSAGSVIEVR